MMNKLVNKLVPGFRKIDRILDKAELVCTKTDGSKYDFKLFAFSIEFIEKIYNHEITLNEAINDQTELKILINKLNNYNPLKTEKIEGKTRALKSAKKLMKLLIFLKKEFFCIMIRYLKQKKKKRNQKKN